MERLYRSRTDKIIAGIAGGLAKYFKLDPAIIRIIFVLLLFFDGIGVILYIILWIAIPFEAVETFESASYNKPNEETKSSSNEPTNATIEDATIIDETFNNQKSQTNERKVDNQSHFPENNKKVYFGIALIVIGTLFLANKLLPSFSFKLIVPAVLVVVGIYLLMNSRNPKEN